MQISEEGKARLMVIPVVAMLAVTMVVAGWQQEEEKVDIEVDEGYGEMSIEYIKSGEVREFYNRTTDTSDKNATAVTYVDGKNNTLEFKVLATYMYAVSNEHRIQLQLNVEGDFKQKYEPKELLLQTQGLNGKKVSRNLQGFDQAFLKEDNMKKWPGGKCNSASRGKSKAFLGFDIKENNFSNRVRVTWTIPKPNWNNTYTFRLQSMVKGMSEDVTATVDVNIQEEVKA